MSNRTPELSCSELNFENQKKANACSESAKEAPTESCVEMPTEPGSYLIEVTGLIDQPESGFNVDYCRFASDSDGGGMEWIDHYRHNIVAWYRLPEKRGDSN